MGTFIERSTALEMIALAMDPAGHPELVGNQHWVERRRKGTALTAFKATASIATSMTKFYLIARLEKRTHVSALPCLIWGTWRRESSTNRERRSGTDTRANS